MHSMFNTDIKKKKFHNFWTSRPLFKNLPSLDLFSWNLRTFYDFQGPKGCANRHFHDNLVMKMCKCEVICGVFSYQVSYLFQRWMNRQGLYYISHRSRHGPKHDFLREVTKNANYGALVSYQSRLGENTPWALCKNNHLILTTTTTLSQTPPYQADYATVNIMITS
jgi:hypothetical protein